MPNKKNRKDYKWTFKLEQAFREIRKKYPKIKAENIIFAGMVFYPIALIDIEVNERSFEDFDIVELTILKFICQGMKANEIATFIGLPVNYVNKMIYLLQGYGHVDKYGKITDLGKESIQKEEKIILKESRQKVQMDILNLAMISKNEQINGYSLYERKDACDWNVGVLAGPSGLNAEDIAQILYNAGYDEILKRGRGVLHVNVNEILKIECLKLEYAKCCMLQLEGMDMPVIFGKRYLNVEDVGERFPWLPFSVNTVADIERYDFPKNTMISTNSNTYVYSVKSKFDKLREQTIMKMKETSMEENKLELSKIFIQTNMKKIFGLHNCEILPRSESVILRAADLENYTKTVFNLLYTLGKEGKCPVVSDTFCGMVITVIPGEDIILLVKKLVDAVAVFKKKTYKILEEYVDQESDDDLARKLLTGLEQMHS
jgi:hypothetical protein